MMPQAPPCTSSSLPSRAIGLHPAGQRRRSAIHLALPIASRRPPPPPCTSSSSTGPMATVVVLLPPCSSSTSGCALRALVADLYVLLLHLRALVADLLKRRRRSRGPLPPCNSDVCSLLPPIARMWQKWQPRRSQLSMPTTCSTKYFKRVNLVSRRRGDSMQTSADNQTHHILAPNNRTLAWREQA